LPAGKVYHEPVIQLDILPTALAAAGREIPRDAKIEGVDLMPYLNGEKTDPPHDALYWRLGDQMAIRQGDWKLVRYDPRADGQRGAAGEPKLYNLAEDIGETKNLFDDEPQRAAALQAAWDKWNSSNEPPRWGDGSGGRRRNAPNRKNASQHAG
jgi:arylsulfatase A-like enzyme